METSASFEARSAPLPYPTRTTCVRKCGPSRVVSPESGSQKRKIQAARHRNPSKSTPIEFFHSVTERGNLADEKQAIVEGYLRHLESKS